MYIYEEPFNLSPHSPAAPTMVRVESHRADKQQLQLQKQLGANSSAESPPIPIPTRHTYYTTTGRATANPNPTTFTSSTHTNCNRQGNGGVVSKRKKYGRASYPTAFILFAVGVLLAGQGLVGVGGASLNSTLARDLLLNRDNNSNNNNNTNSNSNNYQESSSSPSGTPSVQINPSFVAAFRSNNTNTSKKSNDSDIELDSSGSTPLPVYLSDPDKSNFKRTISHLSPLNEHNSHPHRHINFTLPIPESEQPPIIVKHGNIIYELVDNGTISTNMGTFSIPILTAPLLSRFERMGLYEQMTATVLGLRVEDVAKGVSYDEDGVSKILANSEALVRFSGKGFTNRTLIRFVTEPGEKGTDCDDFESTKFFHLEEDELTDYSALAKVTLRPLNDGEKYFYVCVREEDADMPWVHQGTEPWIVLTTYKKWLPLWAHIIMLVVLLTLSGLFSGLNLGLMAIDRTEIKIIMNAGSEKERRYAKQIRPLRDNGNYLLCSLLLGNVLVNASLTIFLDDISSGLIAVVGSTVGIVIFGEIVPQAVCSRHGLAVGAKTVWITKFFMAVTFPLSYPISVILDKVLGEEIGNVYNRERLKELILVTEGVNDLEKQEVNIISGALDLKQKTVVDVMTRLDEVYMLPIDAVLDFDTVSEIMSNGYSRIPVFENQRGNVVSLLYAKDLAFVDPDDKMPLRTICEFYSNPCHFVFENVTLNVLFNVFKQGKKGHMAFVQRIKSNDKEDPTYEVIGLVTMEDVIEELIQEEINDETDVWELADNRRNNRNHNISAIPDGAIYRLKTEGTTVSPQLTLAAFQYLSTAVEEFNDTRISKNVLDRLLRQSIYFHVKIRKDMEKTDPTTILYERGKPADYFIMILEGKVHAEVGKECLLFEGGPFTYFGTSSLCPVVGDNAVIPSTPLATRKISQTSFSESAIITPTFIPDYTVRAVTDLTYFQISRSMYQAATQATMLEKAYNPADIVTEEKSEAERTENSLDEEQMKDKPLTVKPTARGSLSEVFLRRSRSQVQTPPPITPPHLHQQQSQLFKGKPPHHETLIGDNNNVCLNMTKREENIASSEQQAGTEATGNASINNGGMIGGGGNNILSRMILIPKDETPTPEQLRRHPDNTFLPGTGGGGPGAEQDKTNSKL